MRYADAAGGLFPTGLFTFRFWIFPFWRGFNMIPGSILRRSVAPVKAIALALVLACASLPAKADLEAAKEFDQLFGEAVKQATATPDAADDISLAKKLIEAAGSATDKLPLMTVMLEKAYDLSARDTARDSTGTGTATAISAMEALADRFPDRRVASTQKILTLLQRDYSRAKPADLPVTGNALIGKLIELGEAHASAGDLPYAIADYTKALPVSIRIKSAQEPAIRARILALTHRNRIESQIAILSERVLKDRSDKVSATELVSLYITELNKPSVAQQYLDIVTDEETKKHVPLAAKDTGELAAQELLWLGTWYETISKKAGSIAAKRITLTRAEGYFESFLEKQSDQDLTKLQAELALKRVQTALKDLTPETLGVKETVEKIFVFTGKPLAIEAEKAQVVEEPMKIEKTSSASGGAYIWRPGTIGQRVEDGGGHVVFHVKTSEAVDVYLWGRVRSPDEANNSFYIAFAKDKVTTGDRRRWDLPTDSRNWTWTPFTDRRIRGDRPSPFDREKRFGPPQREPEPIAIRLEAGVNSIIITPREHGAQLDSIYLSKTPDKPQGR